MAPFRLPAEREVVVRRLKKRSEFLRVARGTRVGRSDFSLQAIRVPGREEAGLGFTVTKQMGNAPERNRIRRRLKGNEPLFPGQPEVENALVTKLLGIMVAADGVVGGSGMAEALVITDDVDHNLMLSSRNLPNVMVLDVAHVDPVSLIRFRLFRVGNVGCAAPWRPADCRPAGGGAVAGGAAPAAC